MRVNVWKYIDRNNPKAGFLGEGEFLGCVLITEVYSEEEYKQRKKEYISRVLKQMGMPEEGAFFEETFERIWQREMSLQPYNEQTTPKIRLDSGEIVYGCQIWWKEIK